MERIKISLDQFSQEEINLANANFTTSDLIKFKNKNSVFFRKNNKFINICQKYGVKTILILQYVISIAFKKAQKHNNPFCIKYQTINEHLTEEYKCSYQYISCCIKLLIEEGIITRSRQGKNYWLMQLTPIGYEWIYGFLLDLIEVYAENKKDLNTLFMSDSRTNLESLINLILISS